MYRQNRFAVLFLVHALFIFACEMDACGPDFPNWYLTDADKSVLAAPKACFLDELVRMQLLKTIQKAEVSSNPISQTLEKELWDLKLALKQRRFSGEEIRRIVSNYLIQREKISVFAAPDGTKVFHLKPDESETTRISPKDMPVVPEELPEEFALYFRGCIDWHMGKFEMARNEWLKILELPAGNRQYKSTWAAYMIAKSWEGVDNAKALAYYQMVRQLKDKGFSDSLGLSVDSLGWEARLRWRSGQYQEAMDLYLEQIAAGDLRAVVSLDDVISDALGKGPKLLLELAKNPRIQQMITAYLISTGGTGVVDADGPGREFLIDFTDKYTSAYKNLSLKYPLVFPAGMPIPAIKLNHRYKNRTALWLETIEKVKYDSIESGDKLALAAYQTGDMEVAKRWLARSPATPTSMWLKAKLLLYDGKIDEATTVLSKVVKMFPTGDGENPSSGVGVEKNLYVSIGFYDGYIPFERQISAELGLLKLARCHYVESLDLLLRGGVWDDAAYVAERVLDVDELKKYVDRNWPASSKGDGDEELLQERSYCNNGDYVSEHSIRHLLARRLARSGKVSEAIPYYPVKFRKKAEEFDKFLTIADNRGLPAGQRAFLYWNAAKIAKEHGMELFATELEPDWYNYKGSYEGCGPRLTDREGVSILSASRDERLRAYENVSEPNVRYHFRYTAAGIAWKAAELMPNNSDETATVLCTAGSWLKNRDPKSADVFYKTLVKRCRKTATGAEADSIRWFPVLDNNGNLAKK